MISILKKQTLIIFFFHILAIVFVLEILGVGHLASHPVILGAILLSYYDLWIK